MQLKLRPFSFDDVPNLVRYANNPRVAAHMTDGFPHPYDEEDAMQFINMANGQQPNHILAIEVDGEAVGGIGLHRLQDVYRTSSELGYWLAEPFWGNGIVSEAVQRMVEYGFANWEITRIFARPFGSNAASQRVLEKCGFTREARFEKTILKNGVLLDELVYAIRKPA